VTSSFSPSSGLIESFVKFDMTKTLIYSKVYIGTTNIERSDPHRESDIVDSNEIELSKNYNPSNDLRISEGMIESHCLQFSTIEDQSVELTSSNSQKATIQDQSRDFLSSTSPTSSDYFNFSNRFGESFSLHNSLTNEKSESFQRSNNFTDSLTQFSPNIGYSAAFEISAEGSQSKCHEESKLNDVTGNLSPTNGIEDSIVYYSEQHHISSSLIDSSTAGQSCSMKSTAKVNPSNAIEISRQVELSKEFERSELLKSTTDYEGSSSIVCSEHIVMSSVISGSPLLTGTSDLTELIVSPTQHEC
jgi:hypothetical protein